MKTDNLRKYIKFVLDTYNDVNELGLHEGWINRSSLHEEAVEPYGLTERDTWMLFANVEYDYRWCGHDIDRLVDAYDNVLQRLSKEKEKNFEVIDGEICDTGILQLQNEISWQDLARIERIFQQKDKVTHFSYNWIERGNTVKIEALLLMCCMALSCVAFETTTSNLTKGLSESEKIALIKDTNLNVFSKIPDSREWKIDRICSMNVDFVKSCPISELGEVVAEVFATVPQCAFPRMVEELSSNVFNRASMGFKKDDDSFKKFACKVMMCVYKRCRSDNNLILSNQRRIAFAGLTFLKASEGEPKDFAETMLYFVPDTVRDIARNEWFPKANGNPPSYAPIMDSATNDVEYGKSEKWNDDVRMRLGYPSSEHQMTKVQMTMEIEKSTLLLTPILEDDMEFPLIPKNDELIMIPKNEEHIPNPTEPRPYQCQCW